MSSKTCPVCGASFPRFYSVCPADRARLVASAPSAAPNADCSPAEEPAPVSGVRANDDLAHLAEGGVAAPLRARRAIGNETIVDPRSAARDTVPLHAERSAQAAPASLESFAEEGTVEDTHPPLTPASSAQLAEDPDPTVPDQLDHLPVRRSALERAAGFNSAINMHEPTETSSASSPTRVDEPLRPEPVPLLGPDSAENNRHRDRKVTRAALQPQRLPAGAPPCNDIGQAWSGNLRHAAQAGQRVFRRASAHGGRALGIVTRGCRRAQLHRYWIWWLVAVAGFGLALWLIVSRPPPVPTAGDFQPAQPLGPIDAPITDERRAHHTPDDGAVRDSTATNGAAGAKSALPAPSQTEVVKLKTAAPQTKRDSTRKRVRQRTTPRRQRPGTSQGNDAPPKQRDLPRKPKLDPFSP